MTWGWIFFEIAVNIVSNGITLYLAYGLFHSNVGSKVPWGKTVGVLMLGVIWDSLYLIVKMPVSDLVPSAIVFFLYARIVLRTSTGSAMLWSAINNLIAGIVMYIISTLFSLSTGLPIAVFFTSGPVRVVLNMLMFTGRLIIATLLPRMLTRHKTPLRLGWGWLPLLAVPLFSIALLFSVMRYQVPGSEYLLPASLNVFLGVGLLGINIGLVCFVNVLHSRIDETLRLTARNQALAMQLRQQEEIGAAYQDIRRNQHDFNHHLHTIRGLLAAGNLEAMETYLLEITEKVGEMVPGVQTGNAVMDAVLSAKLGVAKTYEIRVEREIALAPNLPFDADKLCVLLGNLMDNAIEAAARLPKEKRWITLSLRIAKGSLFLEIQNATDGIEKKDGERWVTQKAQAGRHGFGLTSVDAIVREYGGFCQRAHKNKVFATALSLPLPSTYP